VGKWTEMMQTLITKGLQRGHFSKKSGQKPKFFGQKVIKSFLNKFCAQKKWAKARF